MVEDVQAALAGYAFHSDKVTSHSSLFVRLLSEFLNLSNYRVAVGRVSSIYAIRLNEGRSRHSKRSL